MFKRFFNDMKQMTADFQAFYYKDVITPFYSYHYNKELTHITQIFDEKELEQKMANVKKPVMINFYEAYSNVCLTLNNRVEPLAEKFGKYKYFRVEVGENEGVNLMVKYGVERAPTLLVLKEGVEVGRWEEIPTDEELEKLMK